MVILLPTLYISARLQGAKNRLDVETGACVMKIIFWEKL